MTWTISKDFTFSASHVLDGLVEGHPCGRLHGHNYVVRVELTGNVLDETGMIVDYGELKPFGRYVDDRLDHRHLNDLMGEVNPTAENIAAYLTSVVRTLTPVPLTVGVAVGVSETPKTWAWCRP